MPQRSDMAQVKLVNSTQGPLWTYNLFKLVLEAGVMDSFSSEYINESHANRIVGVVGAFYFLALIFVSLRIYVRVLIVRDFGVDDGLIIVVAALAFASWLCLILQIPSGLGRHGLTIPVDHRIKFEHISFWKTVLSDGFALGLLRISIAISLLRLNRDLKWYRWSLYATMAFVVAYSIQAIAWLFVYCKPYSGWWEFQWMNPFDPRCADFNIFLDLTYWNISCNIFTDICLGALPIPIIWNLQLKLRVRLYVIAILNLGYFAVLMGILKAVFMLTTGGSPDTTFDYWVHLWENLQLDIGITAACASFLKPLVGRFLKINSSAAYYASSQQYNRSGRTPLSGGIGGSNAYTNSKRRAGLNTRDEDDEFMRHIKNDVRANDIHLQDLRSSPVETKIQSAQSSPGDYSTDPIYDMPSHTNSEEVILQNPKPPHGIMCTRDVTLKYSNKVTG
ncbi:hypothetical protein V495_05595 [Pseudogymnoascus sp. VKM F-4514 (FW-929)]|nr:hypothetical protein V495_05595 [Pseudogymnoascus sp. VKM F-4514 (FW-929)]KFY59965.1 hypothetical protein V497_03983 [Pseudogymnoascus sp. VKM F-4516 (FW-969)]